MYPIDHVAQFKILLSRAFKEIIRDKLLTRIRAGAHVGAGILIGLLYLRHGIHSTSIPTTIGYYFFRYQVQAAVPLLHSMAIVRSILFLMLATVMPTVLSFPIEKEIFKREHFNNWYSVRAYYMAKTVCDLPFQVLGLVVCSVAKHSTRIQMGLL